MDSGRHVPLGRGRFVIVGSQGGLRGFPSSGAYAAVKSAVERWAKAMAAEISPFGLGVTVLLPGAFRTDIFDRTTNYADHGGPYGPLYACLEKTGYRMIGLARPANRFAPAVEKALLDTAPFVRRPVGPDARLLYHGNRVAPARLLPWVTGRVMGLPRAGSLR